MRGGLGRLAAALGLGLAVLGGAGSQPSAPPPLSPLAGQALLESGPDPVLGLPFFGPNAIPSLRGSYRAGEGRVGVWFTREPLVFGPGWTREGAWPLRPGGRAFSAPREGGGLVLAEQYTGWSVLLELPSALPVWKRFVGAFLDRFAFFLANAPRDSDISFPASLSY